MTPNNFTLITGASSGIGEELAKICASKKHNLVIVARNENKLNILKNQLETLYNIQIKIITKDLIHTSAPQEIYDFCAQNKLNVNILINNAGFGAYGKFEQLDWQKQSEMLNLNIHTLTNLTHLFLPQMIKNNYGKIMNLASTAAFLPGPYMSVYYATKAYVLSFSEALAEELSSTNITITALCPGPTESGFQHTASIEDSPLVKDKKLPTSQEVAQYGYQEMIKGTVVAIHGLRNRLIIPTIKFFPRKLVTKGILFLQKKRTK